MKKICSVLFILYLIASLVACDNSGTVSDQTNDRFCVECGGELSSTDNFCGSCGASVNKQDNATANGTTTAIPADGNTNVTDSANGNAGNNGSSDDTVGTPSVHPTGTSSSNAAGNTSATGNTNAASHTSINGNTTAHAHRYSDATCTAPAKCSCGATKGAALGHKWQEATCQAPKTCRVCKTTEGKKADHVISGNTCKWCKQVVPVSISLLKSRNYTFYKLIDYPFPEEGLAGTIALYTASINLSGNQHLLFSDGMYHEGVLSPNYPAEAPRPISYNNKLYFPNTSLGPFAAEKSVSGNRLTLTFTLSSGTKGKIEFELLSNDTLNIVSMTNIPSDPCKFNFSVGDVFA